MTAPVVYEVDGDPLVDPTCWITDNAGAIFAEPSRRGDDLQRLHRAASWGRLLLIVRRRSFPAVLTAYFRSI